MSKKYDEFKEMAMSDMSSNSIFPSYMNHQKNKKNNHQDIQDNNMFNLLEHKIQKQSL